MFGGGINPLLMGGLFFGEGGSSSFFFFFLWWRTLGFSAWEPDKFHFPLSPSQSGMKSRNCDAALRENFRFKPGSHSTMLQDLDG